MIYFGYIRSKVLKYGNIKFSCGICPNAWIPEQEGMVMFYLETKQSVPNIQSITLHFKMHCQQTNSSFEITTNTIAKGDGNNHGRHRCLFICFETVISIYGIFLSFSTHSSMNTLY